MDKVVRAIQKMEACKEEVDDAGIKFWNYFEVYPTGAPGLSAVDLVRQEAMGLDAAHTKINALIEGGLDLAKSKHCPSQAQERAIRLLERALTTLRDSNRSVVRRLHRLQSLARRLSLLNRPFHEDRARILSKNDLELKVIAGRFAASIEQLVGRLQAGEVDPNIINLLQQEINQQLATPVPFNHARFSGVLNVKSLNDLEEVRRISTPHQGLPARHVDVRLRGLSVLSDAATMAIRVDEAIRDRGWVVRGIGALTRAQQIGAHLVALEPLLTRLYSPDVIDILGAIRNPGAIADIEQQVLALTNDLFAQRGVPEQGVVCPEVMGLLDEVGKVVTMAQSEHLSLRNQLKKVLDIIEFTRSESITFE